HDMCVNSCVAFTGPYSALDRCLLCKTSQWNEELLQGMHGQSKVPTKKFTTI
ncbi:hypothetical protein M404DRAFT_112169, partial [Pisolithus tinctorius Marx 270]